MVYHNYNIHRRIIITVLFLFLFISVCMAKEIHSTKAGGNWNDKTTWIGGQIPLSDDLVILDGNVTITDTVYCDSLYIGKNCLLTVNPDAALHALGIGLSQDEINPAIIDNFGTITIDE